MSLVGSTPDLLVVNMQCSIKSVNGQISDAKKAPGKMTFDSSGLDTLSQLEPELLASQGAPRRALTATFPQRFQPPTP